jgi:hypothetical protein
MAATYVINVTDAQQKALEYIFYSPQEWIESTVKERANSAMQDIILSQLRLAEMTGEQLSGTAEQIVLSANIRSVVERRESINLSACNTIEVG